MCKMLQIIALCGIFFLSFPSLFAQKRDTVITKKEEPPKIKKNTIIKSNKFYFLFEVGWKYPSNHRIGIGGRDTIYYSHRVNCNAEGLMGDSIYEQKCQVNVLPDKNHFYKILYNQDKADTVTKDIYFPEKKITYFEKKTYSGFYIKGKIDSTWTSNKSVWHFQDTSGRALKWKYETWEDGNHIKVDFEAYPYRWKYVCEDSMGRKIKEITQDGGKIPQVTLYNAKGRKKRTYSSWNYNMFGGKTAAYEHTHYFHLENAAYRGISIKNVYETWDKYDDDDGWDTFGMETEEEQVPNWVGKNLQNPTKVIKYDVGSWDTLDMEWMDEEMQNQVGGNSQNRTKKPKKKRSYSPWLECTISLKGGNKVTQWVIYTNGKVYRDGPYAQMHFFENLYSERTQKIVHKKEKSVEVCRFDTIIDGMYLGQTVQRGGITLALKDPFYVWGLSVKDFYEGVQDDIVKKAYHLPRTIEIAGMFAGKDNEVAMASFLKYNYNYNVTFSGCTRSFEGRIEELFNEIELLDNKHYNSINKILWDWQQRADTFYIDLQNKVRAIDSTQHFYQLQFKVCEGKIKKVWFWNHTSDPEDILRIKTHRHLARTRKEKQIVKAIQSQHFPYQPIQNVKKKIIFDFDLFIHLPIIRR